VAKQKSADIALDEEIPFVGRSFYGELGIVLKLDKKTHKPSWPSSATVERKWLQAIANTHPLCVQSDPTAEDREPGVDTFQERRFRTVMEAGLTLLDPVLGDRYRETLVGAEKGHASWLKSDERMPYTADPLPDWVCIIGQVLVDQAVYSRGDMDSTMAAMRRTDTGLLPDYIPGERLIDGDKAFDVKAVMDQVLDDYAEHFFELRRWLTQHPGGLGWTWRRKHWKSSGMQVLGKARKLSAKDRARAPGSDAEKPHGEIVLALDYWLVADDKERLQLVFHELLHFDPDGDKLGLRGHVVERFPEELEVFGIVDRGEAELVAAAIRHEKAAEQLESFGVLDDDQLVMFREFVAGARPLDKAV